MISAKDLSRISRRRFLSASGSAVALGGVLGSVAACAFPKVLAAQSSDGYFDLVAAPGRAPLLGDEGPATDIWAYGGTSPGPVIRVRQGAPVKIRLHNNLAEPTSTHWHGIRIDNAMDGVSGLTQDAVPPGGTFDYDFIAPDAGTYWYHSHNRSWEQMARGLYGPLIVEETAPLPVDRELLLVIDDWRLHQDGRIHEESFGAMMDWSHGGRMGNWLTINGVSTPELKVKRGERLRLRLINCANARTLSLKFGGEVAPQVMALDGQPLAGPEAPGSGGVLTLAPAQRADLLLDVDLAPGTRVLLSEVSRQEGVAIGSFLCDGVVEGGLAGSALPLLAPNVLPAPDLSDPLKLGLVMEGGAMGGLGSAVFEGRELSMRELVAKGQVWAFNGVAGMTGKPLASVRRGRSVVLDFVNRTGWPHGMHIHGHHFRIIARDGKPVSNGPWRDTELVEANEAVTVAFVADNPGKWLLHCHMLEHQAAGMKTWFEVVG
jgi:FtsP/CotA-like multicopper oxidase with cupredoxin domain